MGVPLYPADLEAFWLQRAATSLHQDDAPTLLDQLRPEVARLSDLFTVARPNGFGRYGDELRAQMAYALFFFPQTYVRTGLALAECLAGGRWTPPLDRPLRVLDLGAGLGAGLLAAAHALRPRALELTALDHAAGSLTLLQEVFAHQQLTVTTRPGHLLQALPENESWDLILCSFALNEAVEGTPDADVHAWARRLLQRLALGGLLLILEPALDAAALRLEVLRDALAEQGHGCIIAPCLHHQRCPLRSEGRSYCHEVRRWTTPESVAYLNRHLFRDLQVLKFCFLALTQTGRPAPVADPAHARLIAPVDQQNGKIVTRGCAADGAAHGYEVLNRHLTREERDALGAVERGARVRWPELKPISDGRILRAASKPTLEA